MSVFFLCALAFAASLGPARSARVSPFDFRDRHRVCHVEQEHLKVEDQGIGLQEDGLCWEESASLA